MSSQAFPILKENEVALSRADLNTGTVLDEDFKYASTPNQTVYTIYENVEKAIDIAKQIVRARPHVECYVHSKDMTLLYFVDVYKKA